MTGFDAIEMASKNSLNKFNIWKEMIKGAGFIDFSGHGSPNSWATHPHNNNEWLGITIFDIPFYFNENCLPIIFANACHMAQFNLSYECFGWSFLRKFGGGAIAFIGSTGLSYGYGGKFSPMALSGYLEVRFFKNYFNSSSLGEMYYNTLVDYLNNVAMDDWQDYKTLEEYVIFGDASLKINML